MALDNHFRFLYKFVGTQRTAKGKQVILKVYSKDDKTMMKEVGQLYMDSKAVIDDSKRQGSRGEIQACMETLPERFIIDRPKTKFDRYIKK